MISMLLCICDRDHFGIEYDNEIREVVQKLNIDFMIESASEYVMRAPV
jgi:hypothetical protein